MEPDPKKKSGRGRRGSSRGRDPQAPYIPPEKYFIKPSEEFDLKTCFNEMKPVNVNEEGLDYYFDGYSQLGIHQEMLKDHTRTSLYRKAIEGNHELFKDKIVLDIGCGTGILSIFAAKAGAKHVYGIDYATIAYKEKAKEIVKVNGMEQKVTIIRGKVEEVILPVEKVDIIISEWMGYFLLFESMLDTVLLARDKWLAPGGKILPDRATLHMAGLEDALYREDFIDFWDNVYGVKMPCMKEWAIQDALTDNIDRGNVISTPTCILREQDINLYTVKVEDLDFCSAYTLIVKHRTYFHGVVTWFSAYFSHSAETPVILNTSPFGQGTHWKQTLFYCKEPFQVQRDEKVTGSIAVVKSKENKRELNVKISFKSSNHSSEQFFKLS